MTAELGGSQQNPELEAFVQDFVIHRKYPLTEGASTQMQAQLLKLGPIIEGIFSNRWRSASYKKAIEALGANPDKKEQDPFRTYKEELIASGLDRQQASSAVKAFIDHLIKWHSRPKQTNYVTPLTETSNTVHQNVRSDPEYIRPSIGIRTPEEFRTKPRTTRVKGNRRRF